MPTTKKCRSCATRNVATKKANPDAWRLELCGPCLAEAELENDHSDNGHETPVDGCPTCGPVADPDAPKARKTPAASTVPTDGKAKCPKCRKSLPVTKFPTKRDGDGFARDTRQCRKCRDAAKSDNVPEAVAA